MYRISKKPSDVPAILMEGGSEEPALVSALSADELLKYEFKSSVYGGKHVKEALKRIQHDKCCFCEAKLSHVSHGDVEHFRPKAGWIQADGDALSRPGYWWLAYDFSNLYLSCQLCNQSYKRNYFPLGRAGKRAKSPSDELTSERALIIDPGRENPARHLIFHQEVAVPRDGSKKGAETIKRTGLNRPALVGERLSHLRIMQVLAMVAVGTTSHAADATATIREFCGTDKPYSLMMRANFPQFA